MDMEQLEGTRIMYKGPLQLSPVTNTYEPYYPSWKRLLFRLFVTVPLLMINLILVSCLILIIIRFQSWIDRKLKMGQLPGERSSMDRPWTVHPVSPLALMSLTELFPKILLALVTTIFDDVYKRVCRWLTDRGRESIERRDVCICDLENYRGQRTHDNQMIAKLFAVSFHSFSSHPMQCDGFFSVPASIPI